MSVDFTKFPFSTVVHPDAATLTEAITASPADSGFVLITAKATDKLALTAAVRTFASAIRTDAAEPDLIEVTAFRQLRRDELGGAMPFDQQICESIVANAAAHPTPGVGTQAMTSALQDPWADWVIMLEHRTPEAALQSARLIHDGAHSSFHPLASLAEESSVGAFKNMARYSSVSRDPNVIQFFNLFGAPGDLQVLWEAWQEALPWFFEIAEFRSSFPLLALDPGQQFLLVNLAHLDSTKHFLNGALHDPALANLIARCYIQRKVTLPTPFFCKIAPF